MTISPEVCSRSVNRAIIAELVRLYRETDLGMRLPAYDGRKSLYTAGSLPFSSKEFVVKLTEEDDGMGVTRFGCMIFDVFDFCSAKALTDNFNFVVKGEGIQGGD